MYMFINTMYFTITMIYLYYTVYIISAFSTLFVFFYIFEL